MLLTGFLFGQTLEDVFFDADLHKNKYYNRTVQI